MPEVFILKGLTIYAVSTNSIFVLNVSALDEDVLDDTVEYSAFVVQFISIGTFSLFACAETAEVLGSDWAIWVEVNFDSAPVLVFHFLVDPDCDVQVYVWFL